MEENGHYRDRRLSDPRVTPQPSKVTEDKVTEDDSEKPTSVPVPEIIVRIPFFFGNFSILIF